MSRKFTQARVNAFLSALAQTGNQTLAAEQARVSRSWVQLHRSTDPAFDAAVRAAVAEARVALRQAHGAQGEGCRPGAGQRYLDGVELVVRGTGGSARGPVPGGGKRVQVARARVRQWSPRAEERFLAALTASCNVKAACAEVGLTPASAYNHRLRWPGFARRWDAALEVGYCQLECALIEAGCNLFSGEGLGAVLPVRATTFDQALQLLHMQKHAVKGLGKRPGLPPREPDIEEVRAEILRRIAVMERAGELGYGSCQSAARD